MITRAIILVMLMLFTAAFPLLAEPGGKVLIYYFQNLTGDADYDDLIYKIPLCLHSRLKQSFQEINFIIIDEKVLTEYEGDAVVDLWSRDRLQNSAARRSIKRVLYGFFYNEGDGIVVRGKTYYTDNGIILDVNESTSEFYSAFRELEGLSVADIRNCSAEKKQRFYRPPVKSIAGAQQAQSQKAFSLFMGPLFPVAEWSEIYQYGAYAELSYALFPKRAWFPVGLGFDAGFLYMNREEDQSYVSSSAMVLPAGVSLHYTLIGKRIDWVVVGFSAGLALSKLTVSSDISLSIDVYTKGSLSILFPVGKNSQIALSSGLLTVSYKDSPLNAFFGQIGLRVYAF